MIDADSVSHGLHEIMRDNITEFPSTINTLKRFNLYPEVILGIAYRLYQSISDFYGYRTKICWKVNRGEGMSPVSSCEVYQSDVDFTTERKFWLPILCTSNVSCYAYLTFAQFALLTQTLAVFGVYVLQLIPKATFITVVAGQSAHIGEIFRSKFSDFQNFHTMLYTCAKEFDFIETETLWKLLKTLLIPNAAIVLIALIGQLIYHTLQTLAFTAMALLIMRLKLFWTPQLCLISSLIASRQLFGWGKKEVHFAVIAGVLACMAVSGSANIKHELSIIGEFSNYPQEELVEWINGKTDKDAVFAGSMPVMATVKLCTHRPIVNHPHYEDAGLRERTKTVYTTYSRKPVEEVKKNLQRLGVQYLILEDGWCRRRSRPGCSLPEIWDLEDKENFGKEPSCMKLQKKPGPYFKLVFANSVYQVLQLK
ncbi:Dpy-19-like 1 [Elysia marginata]|uniref:Dpy-19-like 1 n=1 Tax=Elysia marginata TaxID=1093978 RepID=A0AAV4EG76_9GAST|nr:Dpy-19-like 1 [Elysia marginata]